MTATGESDASTELDESDAETLLERIGRLCSRLCSTPGRATPRKKTAPSPGDVFGRQVNFGGKRVNVVQVGLGTNSTFMQNVAGEPHEWDSNTAWLMETVVEKRAARITAWAWSRWRSTCGRY